MKPRNAREPWTNMDKRLIVEQYGVLGAKKISVRIGRTVAAVMNRASLLRKKHDVPVNYSACGRPRKNT